MHRHLFLAFLVAAAPAAGAQVNHHARSHHGGGHQAIDSATHAALHALHQQLQQGLDSTQLALLKDAHERMAQNVPLDSSQHALMREIHSRLARLPLDSTQRAAIAAFHLRMNQVPRDTLGSETDDGWFARLHDDAPPAALHAMIGLGIAAVVGAAALRRG
jgi:hypothetical protein